MHSTFRRRSGAIAGSAIVAAALPLVLSSPAQAATDIDKTFEYGCTFKVNLDSTNPDAEKIDIGSYPVKVAVKATVPDLTRGETVPETPVNIQLTMPDFIQSITTGDELDGQLVSGSSEDAQLEVAANGTSQKYTVNGLSVTYAPIEQDLTKPWTIDITGSTPQIPVPDASSLDLLAPATFTVPATIYNAAKEFRFNADLSCGAPEDRLLATAAIADAPVVDPTDPTPDPTDDPTTDPTDDPTSNPTDDPTVAPTNGSGGTGVGGTGSGLQPAASNDALPNTGASDQLLPLGLLGVALLLGGGGLVGRRVVMARHRA